MTLLDVSIVNVALPSIEGSLGATQSDLQWILSGYALTFALALVPAGRVGDARGRRTVYLVGLAGFVLASAACGAAQTSWQLTAARLVQGAAAGAVIPQVSGFIQQLFQGADRGRAFGVLGATIGLSTAVGPVLGGVILAVAGEDQGWRWIFLVNVPLGAVALVLARRYLPAPRPHRGPRESLDPVGVALLGTALVLLLLPLLEQREWEGAAKWLLLPAAAVVLAGFVLWERHHARRSQPLVDLRLFRSASYAFGTGLALAYFSGFTAIFFVLALYFQSGEGYSPLLSGLAITPFAVGSAFASAAGGRLVGRYGRALVVVGLATVAVGLAAADLVIAGDPERVGLLTALPLLVAGLGSGLVITPNQTLTLATVPVEQGGAAGGVLNTFQRIGAAIGIALVGGVVFNRLESSGGDWSEAVATGLRWSIALFAVALALGVAELVRDRRRPAPARP
ncbi:MFS transporter [Vallicoccus soli]|uniref:MFS transporter n=2 Tax=Vallicoccus soli TaxID=2339232 RepID=A0A3A3Z1R9_9ACTN|nr:MFS transporter [Vallicoccus soli]